MMPLPSALIKPDRSVYCLGEEGREYVIYFAAGGSTGISLPEGTYVYRWFDPREGIFSAEESCEGDVHTFDAPDEEDWTLLIQRSRK
jgi:hypothetical protein